MLAERFNQGPLKAYFCKQHSSGAWKDNVPIYDFGYVNTFRNQIAFKPIRTGSVRDENMKFESNKTSSMKEKNTNKEIFNLQICDLQKFQAAIRYLAIKPAKQVNEMNTYMST